MSGLTNDPFSEPSNGVLLKTLSTVSLGGRNSLCQKKSALELSLFEESSQCAITQVASWPQDHIKKSILITCDHKNKEILLIDDSVTYFFDRPYEGFRNNFATEL